MVDVTIPEEKVDTFLNLFAQYLALLLEGGLVEEAPIDKGFLRQSIRADVKDGAIIISMADYAVHVEYGTEPHVIETKNAKSLSFTGKNGKQVFAKKVMHPGTMPNPFIRRTFFNKFGRFVEEAVEAASRQINTI